MKNGPGEREIVPLSQVIAALESGVSVNGEDRPARDGEPGILKVSAVSGGCFIPSENKAIIPEERSKTVLSPRRGDILISRSNTLDLVGASGYVEEDHPRLFLPDKLWRVVLRDPRRDHPRWLLHVLNSPGVRAALKARATGTSGSMKNTSKPAFLRISVDRPPIAVQISIARLLDCWDKAIAQMSTVIGFELRLRQGLMQQLLTGKRRFREFAPRKVHPDSYVGPHLLDWTPQSVGTFAKEATELNSGNDDLPVLSCTKHYGLVEAQSYFGRRIHGEDTSKYKIVRRGQFAYATNHLEEGSIGLLSDVEAGLVSPMYTVFQTDERVHNPFLFLLFKTESYRRAFAANTNGSVNRRGGLRWSQFSRLQVALPSVREQQRICEVFSLLGREIDMRKKQLSALQTQKKSLMQKLLTGQVRVRV